MSEDWGRVESEAISIVGEKDIKSLRQFNEHKFSFQMNFSRELGEKID